MPEFDRPRAERFMRTWVHEAYIAGTIVWFVLALLNHSVKWALLTWLALWGLTWVINVRGVAAAGGYLADLHVHGALVSGEVLRTRRLLNAGIPFAEVRVGPGDGSDAVRLWCFGLPSQVGPLRRGDEVQVLYSAGLGGLFGRSPRACLPLWRSEASLPTAGEAPDDAIKRELALCLTPLATYYARRAIGCVTLAVSLLVLSFLLTLASLPAGLVVLIVGFGAMFLAAWRCERRALTHAVGRFESRFGTEGEERVRALTLLSDIGKTSPNYKTLAEALARRGAVSNCR